MCFYLLSFFECLATLDKLVFHASHELLQLGHFFLLTLKVLLLLLLFVLFDHLHILALGMQFFKQLFDGFFP